MNYYQNIAAIRRRLGNPLTNAPDDALILQALIDSMNHHVSQLQNTNNHWSISKWRLDVSGGVEDYPVIAASGGPLNFGRPFLIVTADDNDPYHVRVEVPMTLIQNADRQYTGPQQTYSTSEHTAALFAFFREANQWYVKAIPIPAGPGSYDVYFDTAFAFASPADEQGVNNFHHLVRIQTALAVLPFTEWAGATKQGNARVWQMQMEALRVQLAAEEGKYQRQFDQFRSQMTREGVTSKLAYGWQGDDGFGWDVGRMANGWGW